MSLPNANDQWRIALLSQGGHESVRHVDIETRGGNDDHIRLEAGRIVEQLWHATWSDPAIEQMHPQRWVLLQSCLQVFERIGRIKELRVVDFIGDRSNPQQQNGVKLHKRSPHVVRVAAIGLLARRAATLPTRSAAQGAV